MSVVRLFFLDVNEMVLGQRDCPNGLREPEWPGRRLYEPIDEMVPRRTLWELLESKPLESFHSVKRIVERRGMAGEILVLMRRRPITRCSSLNSSM